MGNWWIRFGCFLTGYNYGIVRNSSEVAAKAVKKYTSALLIICIMWFFIGFSFTERYLDGGLWGSIAGAVIAVIIIVQIERQIILSVNPSLGLYISRGLIALMMALIGAVIIDQIIFKKDIELEKITFIETRVNNALPPKTQELRSQIASLDTAISKKENERFILIADIEKHPTHKVFSSTTTPTVVKQTVKDSTGQVTTKEQVQAAKSISVTNVPNPKLTMIEPLEQNIKDLRTQRTEKEDQLINIRQDLVDEINSKVGFLDELEVMHTLISRSNVALGVWLLWFAFLLGLELLVLMSKIGDKENDYEKTVKHHMDIQIRKLDVLANASNGKYINQN